MRFVSGKWRHVLWGVVWCGLWVGLSTSVSIRADEFPGESRETPPAVIEEGAVEGANTAVAEDAAIVDDPTAGSTSATSAGDSKAPPKKKPAKKKPAPPAFPPAKNLPPTGPWKPLFFDNDFSFKSDPDHEPVFGEGLKDLSTDLFGEKLNMSTGGELRHRYMNEDNRLRPGGPVQTDYQLWRWRHYGDLKWSDFRIYAEGIDAESFGSVAPDQQIDVNRWDFLNLFVDVRFLENDLGTHTFRYGRQELLFGRQRLVSPLDWGNTRRNFDGYHYILKGEKYKFDLFAVNPVNSATGFRSLAEFDNKFDHPNRRVWFSGAYYSYTGFENSVVDTYWLYLDTNGFQDPILPDGHRHLVGTRVARLFPNDDGSSVFDWDLEGGMQFGRDNRESVLAGFATNVVGNTWKSATWSPRASYVFYYGSGDNTPGAGHNNTFNTLFPLAHAYWGLSDNLSGQNLLNHGLQLDLKPTSKTAVTTAFHWFELASNGDRLYNVAGVPVGAPGNGRDVGQAMDIYGYYSVNANVDIQMGQSWFWYGAYIDAVAPRDDATQFYCQTSFRY